MSSRTHYQVLQVDSLASQEIIDAVYRKLAKRYHPDVNNEPGALAKMQEINEAYAVLGDRMSRRQYDRELLAARTEHKKQPRGESSATQRPNQHYYRNQTRQTHTNIPPNFPVACQKCGTSDSSLRVTGFPYVVSLVLVTFRRGWSGIYCDKCRRQEMTRAKFISFLFGWWGFPFGIFYTFDVLAKPNEGEVPKDANAAYLRALGAYFLQRERASEAKKAWSGSLGYQYDRTTEQVYRDVFGETSEARKHESSNAQESRTRSSKSKTSSQSKRTSSFSTFARVGGVVIAVLFFALLILSIFDPTRTTSIAVAPQVQHTPTALIPTPASMSSPSLTLVGPSPNPVNNSTNKPPVDWHRYISTKVGFNAYIPDNFTAEVYPPDNDDPARAVSFAADADDMGPDATVISVVAIPMPALEHYQQISVDELKQLTEKWLVQDGVEIVSSPRPASINGHTAVELVHETHLEDDVFSVRANAAMIATSGWLYYIEVAGLSQYEDISREYYETFIESFQPKTK